MKRNEKIVALENEIQAKLQELSKLSAEHEEAAYISICDSSFSTWVPKDRHPEDSQFLEEEYGVTEGDWISSSYFC